MINDKKITIGVLPNKYSAAMHQSILKRHRNALMKTTANTDSVYKEFQLNVEEKGRSRYMWSQRQAVSARDRCSQTHMTDGQRRKRRVFDNFAHPQRKDEK